MGNQLNTLINKGMSSAGPIAKNNYINSNHSLKSPNEITRDLKALNNK